MEAGVSHPTGAALEVALLAPCFWPEVRRGGERFVRELADGLLEQGHRPELITSHRARPSRSVEDGLPITRHWRPPEGQLRRRRFEPYMTHVPFSYLSLRRGSFDLAHSTYSQDALAALRWARRTGRPTVFSFLGLPTRQGLTEFRGRLESTVRASTESSAVVALGKAAQAGFWRWLGVEARVIHPGVDLGAFTPDPAARAETPTLVCAAAIDEPRKRVGLLVEAFARVRREHPDARLVLSRPRDPGLAQRVGATGEGIELRDLDSRAALADAYREAWVSVLPSHDEALGLVLVEALACGTPVAGTAVDGIAEVIDRAEIGRTFEGDDPATVAAALLETLELASDPATSPACRARADAFSTARFAEAYIDLYRELLRA